MIQGNAGEGGRSTVEISGPAADIGWHRDHASSVVQNREKGEASFYQLIFHLKPSCWDETKGRKYLQIYKKNYRSTIDKHKIKFINLKVGAGQARGGAEF